jgi:anti-sigma-K factor RskA
MDYARAPLADALAAQYVAGTLRGPARRRFEALLQSHPALRAAVRDWQDRLIPLTCVVAPEAPPPQVWQGIEGRLWPAAGVHDSRVEARWWQRLALWRGISALATVAALALGMAVLNPPPAQPPVVVVLQATSGATQGANTFVASVSADGRALVTRPLLDVALQPDRVLELWSVPPQGAPLSLGLISGQGVTVVPRSKLPLTLLRGGTAALAVSLEPPGGSPTGQPTGPIVYAGKLQI